MNRIFKIILTVVLITNYLPISIGTLTLHAQVGINDNNASPDASAMLDVKSTDKGMLIPRMTTAQRDLINTPATGLMIYNNTTNSFNYFNGTVWAEIGNDNLGNHTASQNIQLGNHWLSSDGNNEGIRINNTGQVGVGKISTLDHLFQVTNDLPFYRDITTSSTVVTVSSTASGNSNNLVDNIDYNGWASTTMPVQIDFNLGSGQIVTDYAIQFIPSSQQFITLLSPTSWIFEGSNDNTNWTVLDTKSNITFTSHIDTFSTTNTTSYQYYRFNGLQNNDFAVQIMEVEFFNSTPINTNILTVADAGEIQFNNAYTFPKVDGSAGKALVTNGAGQLSWSGATLLTDGDNDTKIEVEKTPDEDIINFSLGGNVSPLMRLMKVTGTGIGVFTTRLEFPLNEGNLLIGVNSGNVVKSQSKYNTYLGDYSGSQNIDGNYNTYLGYQSDHNGTTGSYNTFIGANAGQNNSGTANVFIGANAGQNNTGSSQLIIDNSNTAAPLIHGDFLANRLGINRIARTNALEVEGDASKTTAGNWIANSDARLKTNITPLSSEKILNDLLALKGITYEWNDTITGNNRPKGIQYGFTAQNIQAVFPTLVDEDALGYLQTAYGTYDAMTVEAIRALNDKIKKLEDENEDLKTQLSKVNQLEQLVLQLQAQINSSNISE